MSHRLPLSCVHICALLILGLGASLFSATSVEAQEFPSVNIQQFRPAPGPADYLTVYGTGVPAHLDWTASFFFNYADAPLQLATNQSLASEVVDYQAAGDIMAVLGLYGVAELGLVIPAVLTQDTEDPTPISPGNPDADLNNFALSDPRLTTKITFLTLLNDGFGVSLVNAFYLPIGDTKNLSGDGGFNFETRGVGEYMLPWGGVRLAANLGYRYRSESRSIEAAFIQNEILWGLGSIIPLWQEKLDLVTEINGASATSAGDRESIDEGAVPSEFLSALRFALDEDWTLTGGFGTRLSQGYGSPDNRVMIGLGGQWVSGGKWNWDYDFDGFVENDQCPRDPEDRDGFLDDDGCPDPDNDGDGIPDERDKCPDAGEADLFAVLPNGCPDNDMDGDHIFDDRDKCPEDPEDFDGFEDGDGCPDIDNDNDGILDTADSCPDSAETVNGIFDEDGCPEKEGQKVIVTRQKIEILEKVYFQSGSAKIQTKSYEVLDEVADAMRQNRDINKLQIEGHTDDVGPAKFNLRLSQNRAESVRKYLIEQAGVSGDRLVAIGYGEDQPIAQGTSADARGRNRRVDFVITERDTSKSNRNKGFDPDVGDDPFGGSGF